MSAPVLMDVPPVLSRTDRIRAVRETLARAGVLGSGSPMALLLPQTSESLFGDATPIEGDSVVARVIEGQARAPDPVGFCDGMLQFSVEGWVGVCPVVRAAVSAAVLVRRRGKLTPVVFEAPDDFLIAPLNALDPTVADELRDSGMQVLDTGESPRRHPIADLRTAVQLVQRRRFDCERKAAARFRADFPDEWLVVDGSLRGYDQIAGQSKLIGVIKSHETQYLAGADLEVALTLAQNHRTTVFERRGPGETGVLSWYMRLWDWDAQELLYGLIRLERPISASVVGEADEISRWILAEKAPLAGDTRRWDRSLYPIRQVELYLRTRAGGWA